VRLPRLLAGGAVVAVLTGTAACGLQTVEPKIELRDAFHDFAAGRTGALQLSIPSSAAEVRAFAGAADPSTGPDMGMPDEVLNKVLSSSLDVAYDLGADRKSETDDASRIAVHIGDLDAGELRLVDQTAYVRVDVDGLVQQFPDMQEGVDSFRAGITGDGGAPAEVIEPATALLDGNWVSVDIRAYLDQLKAAGAGGDQTDPGLSAADYAKARDLVGAALQDAVVSVQRRGSDDDLGDHLVAKFSLRKAYAKVRSDLPGLLTGAAADSATEEMPPVSEIPDKNVDVSFWVRDGGLTRVELDAAQFLDKPAGHLVLRAGLLPEDKIAAPSGAVKFDIEAMGAAMGGLMNGSLPADESGNPALNAHAVATWVGQDIASMSSEDGGQPSVLYLPRVMPDFTDIAPGLSVSAVDQRVQVDLDGQSACLTLSADGSTDGTVVDGPC
jgi:hypothetical protein